MSGTQSVAPGAASEEHDDEETVAAARRMGWKSAEEFGGHPDPEKFVSAKEFLARGFGNPAVLADRYKVLDERHSRLERHMEQQRQQLADATSTVSTLTSLFRTSEERAYARARKELEAERAKAVEIGDTAAFQRVDQELEELRKSAPAPVSPPQQAAAAPPPAAPAAPVPAQAPEVQDFYRRNPWYLTDPELQREADIVHIGLRSRDPNMPLAENLAETERRVRMLFPDKFRSAGGGHAAEGAAEGNSRRSEAPAVTPSSAGAPTRSQAGRFTFDAMPKESKDAYVRYAKMLEGKGTPLKKEEWAENYWGQFKEDGR